MSAAATRAAQDDVETQRQALEAMRREMDKEKAAMAAEIERDLISQRTKEALTARKAAGMKLGRPRGVGKSKLDKHRPEIEALLERVAE